MDTECMVKGKVLFFYGQVLCNGTEKSLSDCRRSISSVITGSCTTHSYDIGLRCERNIALELYCTITCPL